MTYGPRRRARGVALLIVLVVLVLIATLATEIAITARTTHHMSAHSMDDLLLRTAVDGRVEILKAALVYEGGRRKGYDGDGDEWSWKNHEKLSGWGEQTTSSSADGETRQSAAYKNSNVKLTAWVEDERSKINILALSQGNGTKEAEEVRDVLIRLIDLFREGNSDLDLSDGDGKEMVDDLEKYLAAAEDTEDNPQPNVKSQRGRLQSVDDLLRVPGGHWKPEILYDVKDPATSDDEMGTTSSSSSSSTSSTEGTDAYERQNGIPGLARYLSVLSDHTAGDDKPPATSFKVNLNTAPLVVLKALLDPNDEDLAQKLIDKRRSGAEDTDSTSTSGTTSGSSGDTAAQGYFKSADDVKKVEGMESYGEANSQRFGRLQFFAVFTSGVYSLRVIARVPKAGGSAGDESSDEESAPKEFEAVYDYRQVVQRTDKGFLTLFTERRSDPLFDQ